jgi:hypothetical protein
MFLLTQTADALVQVAEEGRIRRRNASGKCQKLLIRRCPNGETHPALRGTS